MEHLVLPALCVGAFLFFYFILWMIMRFVIRQIDYEYRHFPIPTPINICMIAVAAMPVVFFLIVGLGA